MAYSAFDFTDEQKLVQAAIRRFCERELEPKVPALERGELLPYPIARDLFRALGADELARAAFARRAADGEGRGPEAERAPGDDGAIAQDAALSAILNLELSRVCPGFALAVGASVGLCAGAILARGTARQKLAHALPLLTFEKVGCWAMTEPDAGSDAFGGMRTIARRDGDAYVLSGRKTFITNAPHADTFVVYAKLVERDGDDPRGRPIAAFLVERGAPGLSTSGPMAKMGMHSSPTGEIALDEVRVARAELLGEGEAKPSREGPRDTFQGERAGMVPMCLGIIERCLDDSLRYAKQRATWGHPIAEYQLVQEKLARMYVHRENVRNLLFKLLDGARHGRRPTRAEASAAKLYASRAATEVALEAVQVLGGNGYMREFRVEMLMRDAKLLQIGGGTDEIQILTIARDLLSE